MVEAWLKMVVLFFVIFDPLMSLAVFVGATRHMTQREKHKTAALGVGVAFIVSYAVLFFGERLLDLFSTNLDDLRVGGGVVLGLLGIKMSLGQTVGDYARDKEQSARAVAAIIGTPLLTGPAAITAIIISAHDHGVFVSGTAIAVVLLATALVFFQASLINRVLGKTVIQVISTVLGLVTVSWAVSFIRQGLGF
jgi:multiple antibiotic resistance protein